jgi:endonuclease/exonuclease/phosphatase family metal-dependent hydrolase
MTRRVCALALLVVFGIAYRASAGDVVLYATDVAAPHGNWALAPSADSPGGQKIASADNGWSTTSAALAAPNDYFEASFTAAANTSYHVWLRMRASGDSKWNDSVYVQFNDATDVNGSPIYRVGTTDALVVNLENCSGCGDLGWGWQDRSWWLGQSAVVKFASSGTHTIRVQTREDGVEVDQIVLSDATYLNAAPGGVKNDATIVPKPSTVTTTVSTTTLAYSGTPAAVPGTIQAAEFDNGGEGVSYHDTTAGNSGGAFRSTGVDIEPSSEGGYDVGWTAGGEWLNYTVNVAAAGSYVVQLRVASPSGGASMHVGFNTTSNVWTVVSIPATGSWQSWTTVNVPVTLGAGQQVMTLLFDTGGFNIRTITVVSSSSSSSNNNSSSLAYSGTPVALPGTIEAENFDKGPSGTSYKDTTPGNSGGAYRSTDVDIEPASGGGYDVGWIASGEWLNYTVSVATAGSYTAQLRVASPSGGGALHIGFNGPSNVWTAVNIPATGGWQIWTTVSVPVTLGAGVQLMTLGFDVGGFNIDSVTVVAGAAGPPPPPPPPPPGPGGTLRMMTWNVQSGLDLNHVYNLPAQVQFMAAQKPDVIVLQEVSMWNENQPDKYLSLIQQATGQTWYRVWAPAITCQTSGCIGPMILSRYPISASSTTYLGPSSAGRALITVANLSINILGCHLEAYDTSIRTSELNGLMAWAHNFAGPRLVGGDFNSWWGEWWIGQMETEYSDTWVDYSHQQDGAYTIGNVRFDYIFRSFDNGFHLVPTNAFVPSTTLSDHRPFIADFKLQ